MFPPTNATSCSRARSPKPAANSANQSSSTRGKVRDSNAQLGVAPIAARSLRLTASALNPSDLGAAPARKCTFSTNESVV